jgi:hypothetical protein
MIVANGGTFGWSRGKGADSGGGAGVQVLADYALKKIGFTQTRKEYRGAQRQTFFASLRQPFRSSTFRK